MQESRGYTHTPEVHYETNLGPVEQQLWETYLWCGNYRKRKTKDHLRSPHYNPELLSNINLWCIAMGNYRKRNREDATELTSLQPRKQVLEMM